MASRLLLLLLLLAFVSLASAQATGITGIFTDAVTEVETGVLPQVYIMLGVFVSIAVGFGVVGYIRGR